MLKSERNAEQLKVLASLLERTLLSLGPHSSDCIEQSQLGMVDTCYAAGLEREILIALRGIDTKDAPRPDDNERTALRAEIERLGQHLRAKDNTVRFLKARDQRTGVEHQKDAIQNEVYRRAVEDACQQICGWEDEDASDLVLRVHKILSDSLEKKETDAGKESTDS